MFLEYSWNILFHSWSLKRPWMAERETLDTIFSHFLFNAPFINLAIKIDFFFVTSTFLQIQFSYLVRLVCVFSKLYCIHWHILVKKYPLLEKKNSLPWIGTWMNYPPFPLEFPPKIRDDVRIFGSWSPTMMNLNNGTPQFPPPTWNPWNGSGGYFCPQANTRLH